MDKSLPQRDLPFAPSEPHPGAKDARGSKQRGSWTKGGGGAPSSLSFKVSVHQAAYLQRKSLFLLLSSNQRKPSVWATKTSTKIFKSKYKGNNEF